MSDLSISNTTIRYTDPSVTGGAAPVKPTAPTTGAGSLAKAQSTPDATPTAGFSAAMASLAGLMPKMSGDQIDVLIGTISAKMKEATDKIEQTKIKTDQLAKHDAIEQKTAKLKEAEAKIQEAKDKMAHASIWDKIKLAFSYIGALLTMIAGAVMIATGAGAVAGGCLIAAGVIMLALAVDQTVETAMKDQGKAGLGMFGLMAKACCELAHPDWSEDKVNEVAQKAQMGIQIGLMGISLLLSLPAIVPSLVNVARSAASMAANVAESAISLLRTSEKLGETGMEVANTLENIGSKVASAGEKVSEMAEKVADKIPSAFKAAKSISDMGRYEKAFNYAKDVVDITVQVGDGVATGASAGYNYEATDLTSQSKNLQAEGKRFEIVQQAMDDQIDAAIQRLKASGDRFNNMMESLVAAVKDRGDTMAHAKFRA